MYTCTGVCKLLVWKANQKDIISACDSPVLNILRDWLSRILSLVLPHFP